jgi:hypothetical protein
VLLHMAMKTLREHLRADRLGDSVSVRKCL